jgi:phage baseplate assembly protein W
MAADFVGTGFAFPMRLSASGGVGMASYLDKIEQSIAIVLGTVPGERVMRPDFGCEAYALVFAGADATSAGRLAQAVRRALDRWEPRITVEDVVVTLDAERRDRLLVSVRYVVRRTNDVRNLVYPFYTLPKEDEA